MFKLETVNISYNCNIVTVITRTSSINCTICNAVGGSLVQITMYIMIHQISDQSHQSFKVCWWQVCWWLVTVFQLSHRNAHKTHLNLSAVCSNLSVIFVLINQFLVKSISPWAACTDQAQRKNHLPSFGWTFIGLDIQYLEPYVWQRFDS